MPNVERIKTLIQVLRTTAVEQHYRSLAKDDKRCCLGVACDVASISGWVQGSFDTDGSFMGEQLLLPYEVRMAYGFESDNPAIIVCPHELLTLDGARLTVLREDENGNTIYVITASILNDAGVPFPIIGNLFHQAYLG